MIGLVDYDLWTRSSTSLYIPNLEIMKLASYYKVEEKTFCQLVSPDETELEPYEQIFFFSESDDIVVPDAFKRAKNVTFGGTAFTKGKYVPFKNEIIDYTIPRTFIYKNFLSEKYKEGIKNKEINSFLDNSYYRMYAGENKLPFPVVQKKKKIYLYDREFFYPDWKETLMTLSDRSPANIIRVHPITCTTLSQYFDIRNIPKFSRSNEIILDLRIPLSELPVLFSKYEKKFLADINWSSNIYLPLGRTRNGKSIYYQDLDYTLNLLYSYWVKGLTLKIKYIPPNVGTYNPIVELSKLIEKWSNLSTGAKKRTTLISRIKKGSIEEQQYNDFIAYLPEAKDLFNQTFEELNGRRFWKV